MKRILVVDDEPTIRDLVADALRESGYHVDTAANGADALLLMGQHVPDGVVLDIMMPTLDATGFVELMRLNPRYAAVPILVVTATYGAQEAAERLGAKLYLTKPFELDDLVAMVAELVAAPQWLPPPVPDAPNTAAGVQHNVSIEP